MASSAALRHASLVTYALILATFGVAAVLAPPPPFRTRPLRREVSEGRLLWDALGNIITTSEYFPLELNVPDTIGAVAAGINGAWMAVSDHIPRMLWRRLEEMTALFSP